MTRQMRRNDRALPEEEAKAILASALYGVLSTVDGNGMPYGVPLSYAYQENKIYFHCAHTGYKLDNIQHQSKVSFCVVADVDTLPEEFSTKYKSVIVSGKAEIVLGEEKLLGYRLLIEKYAGQNLPAGMAYIERAKDSATVIAITIDTFTGKGRV